MQVIEQPAPRRRILCFDTECRPMHYSDWRPESQITAIAWAWVDSRSGKRKGRVAYDVLARDLSNEDDMLVRFLAEYERADVVMGHYIRKHDLPLLNDHCIRAGVTPISERRPVWTIDTKLDIPQVNALGLSQDNLATLFRLDAAKHHMTGSDWRRANALDPDEGEALTIKRVVGDVKQNVELYRELRARGALRPMKRWPRA